MKYLHSKQIIHRDLKPSNLFIDGEFRIRIGDFGTARCEDSGTTTTRGVGTPLYMAPEIFDGESPTKKVDSFAFGLILYEVLVGHSAFPKESGWLSLVKLHASGTRPSIPKSIQKGIAGLIRRCWSTNVAERPLFDEILGILEDCQFRFYDDVDCGAVKKFIREVKLQESWTRRSDE
jgi:serine/threonine protein kinase